MKLGFVAGTMWNGRQHPDLDGRKLLIVRRVNRRLDPVDDYAVCIDAVGAGEGDWVVTVAGSSARLTDVTAKAAADETIIGIVDHIDIPVTRSRG
jgi:ethanolamine utilization protein EutN